MGMHDAPPKQTKGAMQKDSARLFGTTAVIVTAIIAGAFLLDRANKTGRPLPPEQATWTELTPSDRHPGQPTSLSPSSGSASTSSPSSQPSSLSGPSSQPSRSEGVGSSNPAENDAPAQTSAEGIITCQHPEHGTVYTNAASCDEVDYDSRLTPAEPFEPEENPERYKDE
jgi:hypothetical protein